MITLQSHLRLLTFYDEWTTCNFIAHNTYLYYNPIL